jgi:hypothetical protein
MPEERVTTGSEPFTVRRCRECGAGEIDRPEWQVPLRHYAGCQRKAALVESVEVQEVVEPGHDEQTGLRNTESVIRADERGRTVAAVVEALRGKLDAAQGRASRLLPPEAEMANEQVPWEFSEPPASNDPTALPNVPTPEGRLLGAELARLADAEEARLRERFPRLHPRCNDCAFKAGTDPNGCPETLMDAVKALVECVPFYCHKKFDADGSPKRLCAGYAILAGAKREGVPDDR